MRPPTVPLPRWLRPKPERRKRREAHIVAPLGNSVSIGGEVFPFDGLRPLTLRQVAIHEACHVVVARLLGIRASGVFLGTVAASIGADAPFPDSWMGSTSWRDQIPIALRVPINLAPELHPESGGLGDGDIGEIIKSPYVWKDMPHARRLVRQMAPVAFPEVEALAALLMEGEGDRRGVSFVYDWRDSKSEVAHVTLAMREGDAWRVLDRRILNERDANQKYPK
jgi:hypothetical protein